MAFWRSNSSESASRPAWLPGVLLAALVAVLIAWSLAGGARAETLSIIPAPASVQPGSGAFTVSAGTPIAVPPGDAEARAVATELVGLTARSGGPALTLQTGPAVRPGIRFKRTNDPQVGPEAYSLTVSEGGVVVSARTPAGLFYGAATLWQMLTPSGAGAASVTLQGTRITDQPRFAWRGLLLDSARHYQSVAFIEQMIDWMALHKLNVLQWHLTDDQAWRLEIPKYPRLTQVGAWRTPTAADAQVDPKTGKSQPYGGFYTAADVRRLVAYGQARGVTIVPEIEMPGHALSAILAYPQLGSAGPAPSGIQGDWGVFPYIYNYDEPTFAFLQDVLTQVMALFPSRYINVGGDEAVSDQWKASPQIQARMKALGVANEAALQGVFLERIETFLNAHGRRLVGWDEILGDGLPADATVMSWHGVYGALAAARAGHDAVLAPSPVLYFDHRQGDLAGEPPGRGIVVTLKDVYAFDPAPGKLTEEERRHILGLQANLWTEHIRTERRLEAMTFPRAAAVAEIGWSPASAKDWPGFVGRLPAEIRRYKALGLHSDESALTLKAEPRVDPATGQTQIALSSQSGVGDIRYTTDGSAPTAASTAYAQPLVMTGPLRLRAAAFRGGERVSAILDQNLESNALARRVSQALKLCTDKLSLNLEDDAPVAGSRAVFLVDIMNPCWIYQGRDLADGGVLTVAVGNLPFNFQLGADLAKIALRPPRTAEGELEVRADSCAGDLVASLPLARAALSAAVTPLRVNIPPRPGRHDLCLQFTAPGVDPIWAIDWVRFEPFASSPFRQAAIPSPRAP